jgi:pyridoxine/pyridoxamine 5'-phosphate oxidase
MMTHTAKAGSEPPAALINLVFLANNSSPKFQEIQNDNHVNLSFFHTSSMHWASISGVARVTEDKSVIKKYWSSGYVTLIVIYYVLFSATNEERRRLQNRLTPLRLQHRIVFW